MSSWQGPSRLFQVVFELNSWDMMEYTHFFVSNWRQIESLVAYLFFEIQTLQLLIQLLILKSNFWIFIIPITLRRNSNKNNVQIWYICYKTLNGSKYTLGWATIKRKKHFFNPPKISLLLIYFLICQNRESSCLFFCQSRVWLLNSSCLQKIGCTCIWFIVNLVMFLS